MGIQIQKGGCDVPKAINMLVDTHAHLNFHAFEKDREKLKEDMLKQGMAFVMPGTRLDTSEEAVKLAQAWDDPRIYAAVGLHPIHVTPDKKHHDENESAYQEEETEFDRAKYQEFLSSEKVVAIGEIGLDYWRKPKGKARRAGYIEKQKQAFVAQLDMAHQNSLPVLLHCRVAHDDMLEILQDHPITKDPRAGSPGIVHSYTGNVEQMEKFTGMGFYIAYNALVCILDFLPEVVKATPLERIVLETDSPYLNPPQAKEGKNTPLNIKYTAQKIAELKGASLEEVEKITTENAKKVFSLEF